MDYRLKKRCDFEKVFKKGKRCYAGSLIFVYIKSREFKVGYSVSKKHGNSVRRNRIKRLLRAAMREYAGDMGNYHVVIIPKKECEGSFALYKQDIGDVLRREKLLGS